MEYSHDSALFLTNFSGHSAKFANFNHMVLKFNFMFKIIGVGHKEYQTNSTGGGAYFPRGYQSFLNNVDMAGGREVLPNFHITT